MPVAHGAVLADEPRVDPGVKTDRVEIAQGLRELNGRLTKLHAQAPAVKPDLLADVEVFAKGITWALRYDETLAPADGVLLQKALTRANGRATALEKGSEPWTERKGKLTRGYVSAVDGSVQPYCLIVPTRYDRSRPIRLDVVLHGSTQPVGMSELRFMSRFDEGDGEEKNAPDQDYIELHPLGRVENCYRWAGETDVFEAIEAVCRNYNIDRDRIVLRGMSMGASGTWHLGLKHPDRFVALGPYCGYVDTHQFSRTPLANFVKVGPLPPQQEKALHMLDSIDYAANAGVVPAIACMGEKDVFFQAHVLMGQAMEKEGQKMVNIVSPGTGHVIDPVTHKEQMRQIAAFARKGIDHAPRHLHFVTWTLKYNCCHWMEILKLNEHYARAELDATVGDDGSIQIKEPKNVTLFSIRPPAPPKEGARLRVGENELGLLPRGKDRPQKLYVRKIDGGWKLSIEPVPLTGKRPGLQGPIDDAFTSPFLCVRGTGRPWNPAVQAWSDASLKRFAYEWNRYFRAELPVKDDTAVTEEDARRCNLILFGDPGSNTWIAKMLPRLPIHWTSDDIQFGKEHYRAIEHAPVFLCPNPLSQDRYVVVNSGHTFHEKELASLNYLLFPRLGDWAVIGIGANTPKQPNEIMEENVVRSGFFDEEWKLAEENN
jgi:hypothetical protein